MRRSGEGLTEDEALEEEVDPAHDDHLRDHHHHLRLHPGHHAFHSVRVCQGVGRCARGRVALRRAIFEVGAVRERLRKILGDRLVVRGWQWGVRRRGAEDLGADEGTSKSRVAPLREQVWLLWDGVRRTVPGQHYAQVSWVVTAAAEQRSA